MTDSKLLSSQIITESKTACGTWSISYLKSVDSLIRPMKVSEKEKVIDSIIKHIIDKESSHLEKFKLSQFLSIIKSSTIEGLVPIIDIHKNQLIEFADSLGNGNLEEATKKLIHGVFLYPQNHSRLSAPPKSMSHQPFNSFGFVAKPMPKPGHTMRVSKDGETSV